MPTGVFEYPGAADLSQTGSREVSQGDKISSRGCSVPTKTRPLVSAQLGKVFGSTQSLNQMSGWGG